ncbi:hypothetical protein [Streptomyces sp. NRRL S-481]|uniref:hypothetical protein n=2 Tax=Streptomyces TaxID=1883 RepID=UPI001F458896|nr:hypothetical protein [Streptomyces sp. NRRL S-481]
MEYLRLLSAVSAHIVDFATSMRITVILIAQVGDPMRKLQKAFVVVTMLGSVGVLGAGTAQADDTTDANNGTVPATCTALGGEGGAGGSASISDIDVTQVNIAVADDPSSVSQTNEASIVAVGGDGGDGGSAGAACN